MPSRTHPLTLAAMLAVLAAGWPAPAPAQSDPAAQLLIDQLRPRGSSGTRGIRMPTAEPSQAAPAPARPAPAAAPQAPSPAAPPRVAATTAAPAGAVSATTTAPAGAAAVSLTVNFLAGSATLTPQAEQALAPLGRALSSPDLAPYRFRIEGHTDTVGDAGTNQRLSEQRALAVRDYLVGRHGVAAGRLEPIGLGETRLLVPTPDQTDEPRNRRVQIINLGG